MANHSTTKTPFKNVYKRPPKQTLDLIPLRKLYGYIMIVENMTKRMKDIQAEVKNTLDLILLHHSY